MKLTVKEACALAEHPSKTMVTMSRTDARRIARLLRAQERRIRELEARRDELLAQIKADREAMKEPPFKVSTWSESAVNAAKARQPKEVCP